MNVVTAAIPGPLSSAEIRVDDLERRFVVERRQELVSRELQARGFDGLLIERPENFAWFTVGAGVPEWSPQRPTGALFVTADSRVVLLRNSDTAEVFERYLSGLGFSIKERPWQEPRAVLLQDVCRGRNVASDSGFEGLPSWGELLSEWRQSLSKVEAERLRELGRLLAHAIEATCRNFDAGASEAEVAGHLAHRLLRHEVVPLRIQVKSDGQCERFPHYRYTDRAISTWCSVTAMVSKWGLSCGASRTVFFCDPTDDEIQRHRDTLILAASGMAMCQQGVAVSEIWKAIERAYAKLGHPHDWTLAEVATQSGYEPVERLIAPDVPGRLPAIAPIFWHPHLGMMQAGDTILTGSDGSNVEILTPSSEWPAVTISVRGALFRLPALLVR